MGERTEKARRARVGYGSSYHKGVAGELGEKSRGIGTVLGGQVWMIKPDKDARTANPCLWMQAGVVEFKNCNNYYDCTTCKYDQGMRKQVEKKKKISWQDSMRRRPSLERVCRHSLTNRIKRRVCAYDYECSKCDFDQFFEDVWTPKTKNLPLETRHIKGFEVPSDYYFHDGHTWARIESGGYIRVGMDAFALKLLGKADSFDLPLMGKELEKNRIGWGMRRSENGAEFISPVSGVIVEVNKKVRESPDRANNEPYGDGWVFLLRHPDIKENFKELMRNSASLEWMSKEVGKLEQMVEEVAGPMAADGGYFGDDIYGSIPGLGWNNLTRTFLKTG
ncbi:MAG: hypothetical protein DRG63_13905 [Deltaproteobacteria bacterium]|nr:MAG: hypothetical protein DRG63_13905 [Deltaproteobacteria bacterium]